MLKRKIIKSRGIQVELSIAVMVKKSETEHETARPNARCIGHVGERPISLVMNQHEAVAGANRQVRMTIVVVIAHGAAGSVAMEFDFRRFRHINKSAVTDISIQRGVAFSIRIDKKNVRFPIAVVIKHASATPKKLSQGWLAFGSDGPTSSFAGARTGARQRETSRKPGNRRHVHEMNRYRRRGAHRRHFHLLRERIFALLAVDKSHVRCEPAR